MQSFKTVLFIWIGLSVGLNHIQGQCLPERLNFQAGELIDYNVYYNWNFIWVHAGYADFRIDKSTYNDMDTWHFFSTGRSKNSYDWIYKVRDTFDVHYERQAMLPMYFRRITNEGSYHVDNHLTYDHEKRLAYAETTTSKTALRKDTIVLKDCTLDVLSMIYYARTLDFSGLEENDTVPIHMIIDNKAYDLYIRYMGRETIKTRNGRSFKTIKFRPLLVEGTIFSGGEDMTVWVTDDMNKVPVQVEANILVGSVKAVLETAEGLKYPLEAEIK